MPLRSDRELWTLKQIKHSDGRRTYIITNANGQVSSNEKPAYDLKNRKEVLVDLLFKWNIGWGCIVIWNKNQLKYTENVCVVWHIYACNGGGRISHITSCHNSPRCHGRAFKRDYGDCVVVVGGVVSGKNVFCYRMPLESVANVLE